MLLRLMWEGCCYLRGNVCLKKSHQNSSMGDPELPVWLLDGARGKMGSWGIAKLLNWFVHLSFGRDLTFRQNGILPEERFSVKSPLAPSRGRTGSSGFTQDADLGLALNDRFLCCEESAAFVVIRCCLMWSEEKMQSCGAHPNVCFVRCLD